MTMPKVEAAIASARVEAFAQKDTEFLLFLEAMEEMASVLDRIESHLDAIARNTTPAQK